MALSASQEFFIIPKRLEPKKVLLENSNEPLGTACSLRLMDKSRRRLNAKECDLLLEEIQNKLRAVIMAKRETLSSSFSKSTEELPDTLPDRLKGFKASTVFGNMDSHTFFPGPLLGDLSGG